jgi:ketosteroid isomerase-like protein
MSQENVESVKRSLEAFAQRDRAGWSELCDSEVEAVPVGEWPEGEIRGREAVWDFLLAADEPWEPGAFEATEVSDGPDAVAIRMRRKLRGRSSGVEVDYDYWAAFTFRNGKVIRVEWFDERDEALEAAGLRE